MSPVKLQLNSLCLLLVTLSGIILGLGHAAAAVRVVVEEGEDAVLPCSLSTREDIEFKLFVWRKAAQKDERQKEVFMYDAGVHYNIGLDGQSEQFKGRVSHFPEELKHGNASITIRNTKVTDSGYYTCDFPRLQPPQTFLIELVVDATPEPYIRILSGAEGSALLQCEVRGAFPEPAVEWRDSSGNKLPAEELQVSEREGRFYITLNANVTKTGDYHCIVTQETISHQTEAQTFVHISVSKGSSSTAVGCLCFFGGFLGASVLAAVLVQLVAPKYYTIRRKTGPRDKQSVSGDPDTDKYNL